jgi:hypothetical protein
MFGFQHKKEVVEILDFVLSFLRKYERKESHNMFFLILDPNLNLRIFI